MKDKILTGSFLSKDNNRVASQDKAEVQDLERKGGVSRQGEVKRREHVMHTDAVHGQGSE